MSIFLLTGRLNCLRLIVIIVVVASSLVLAFYRITPSFQIFKKRDTNLPLLDEPEMRFPSHPKSSKNSVVQTARKAEFSRYSAVQTARKKEFSRYSVKGGLKPSKHPAFPSKNPTPPVKVAGNFLSQNKHKTGPAKSQPGKQVLQRNAKSHITQVPYHTQPSYTSKPSYNTRPKDELMAPATDNLLHDDITVVTAYFNLGVVEKIGHHYTPDTYVKWMKVFGWITNPLIVFLEEDLHVEIFNNLRLDKFADKTKIVKVARSQLWAFSLLNKTREIFSNPDYPKHEPNTKMPEYPCAMHAKYELMEKAVKENPFKTKYFSWLDIGLFRDLAKYYTYPDFHLYLPPKFDEDLVAYTEVMPFYKETDVESIFKFNIVWVCGCFFLARAPIMLRWTREYMRFTEKFLRMNLMNSDQQILYAMSLNSTDLSTQIQTYHGDGRYSEWFHLAYLCKEMGHKKDGIFVIRKGFDDR